MDVTNNDNELCNHCAHFSSEQEMMADAVKKEREKEHALEVEIKMTETQARQATVKNHLIPVEIKTQS
jgi:hypothetical protein